MKIEGNTVDEWLGNLPDDWRRERVLALRKAILELDEGIEELLNYGMLCYRWQGRDLFHLNAQAAYAALYVGDIDKVDPERTLLEGLSLGKGCIRFKKSSPHPHPSIRVFMERAFARLQAGGDLDC